MSYHLSPGDGNPRRCQAREGNCPYGEDEPHYPSMSAAREGYEQRQPSSFPAPQALTIGKALKRNLILTPGDASAYLAAAHPQAEELRISEREPYVVLDAIKFPKSEQGQGLGSAFMADLIAIADKHGWRLALTPSTDWGATSKTRLANFYKRFGFLENKGKHKDFTTRETMLRPASS